ncbi:pyridoxal phosphate-dependent aminotransferase [Clostridium sp. 'deep sea']|uniref:pyridoxal phosphate-dependent aminotransferase n=1 Tax=Clostridium sp. 'deep sea' TaxID=2779445 RepID=UPI0018964A07|nr:pyridoxal phosphate-dependent aminotransferase [Clostridium sp. 'deep sea']QOR36236.1 pyridoxal phosphate-dependent aminotransferase [Clostridium sp. 'deep sea']
MKISKRAISIPASPIRKLIPFANEAKSKGTKVYHLNIGQPDIVTPSLMWDNIKKVENKVLAYGPSNGLLEFREKLSEYYAKFSVNVSPAEMIVTTGGSEALMFAMLVICNPDDEVLIPEPYYANYNGFGNLTQVNVKPITTYAENGFHLPTIQEIEKGITPRTKAILFSNPGNPTGVVYTKDELNMLIKIAKKHNLMLIADEVYREFVYEGEFTSLLSIPEAEQITIIADSISKRYSACGARIGCFVTKNKEVLDAAMKYAQARLCPPTLEQIGAIGALNVPHSYYEEILTEYRSRRDTVLDKINKVDGVICKQPKGAFYCIAKLPIDDCEKFAKWMLTDFNVDGKTTMVAPATGFYGTKGSGKDEVRIAYVLNNADLVKAMDILAEGIRVYKETFNV